MSRKLTKAEAGRLGGLKSSRVAGTDGRPSMAARGRKSAKATARGRDYYVRLALRRWGRADVKLET